MRDEDKTKEQLIYELSESRKHNTQLKELEVCLNQTIDTLLKSNKRYQLLYENDIIELKQMEQALERDYELRTSNEQLQLDIIERKRAEEVLLRQHEQLLEQLSFVSAMNLIAGKIINNDNTYNILETMAEIVGSTLRVDRSKIYDIDFAKHLVIGQCEWLNPNTPDVISTKNTYNLDVFIDSCTYMNKYRHRLETHIDDHSPYFSHDGSGDILDKDMHIKSGLWYPFSFREQGYYCLIFNQVGPPRI